MKSLKYFAASIIVILSDQLIKLSVHYYMDLNSEIHIIGDLVKLHYTLNPGMAFGLEFGSEYGKMALTSFRLLSMVAIGYYLYKLAYSKVHKGFVWCMAFILGGAVGNVIDSTFYGVFLDNAQQIDNPLPWYPWFHGQVIDMFYIDIAEGIVPTEIPFIGGSYYSMLPIFNLADVSIFIGVVTIIVMQRTFFGPKKIYTPHNATPSPAPELSEGELN